MEIHGTRVRTAGIREKSIEPPSWAREWGRSRGSLLKSMAIHVEGSRSLARTLVRSHAPPLALSLSPLRGTAVIAITLANRPETILALERPATTYQAYRSQNDLRPLDERDRIERGPGLSAAVRSAVHLNATEAEISKLTQRPGACACVCRFDGDDGARGAPGGCVRLRL